MAIQTRSSLLVALRFIPVVLVLALSFFWSKEIIQRLSVQHELEKSMERLLESESRVQELTQEVKRAEKEAAQAKADTRYLVGQLGERDEHIRRMLAEMIRLLSGKDDINLGEIYIPSDKESWKGVQREMKNITSQPSMIRQVSNITPRLAPAPAPVPAKSFPLRQAKVEEKAVPAITEPAQKDASAISAGRILAVNKPYNFVVVNRGLKDGIQKGMILIASRKGRQVGELEVETTYDKISAAGYKAEKKIDLRVGDTIQVRR